jgi:hypothetical protein
VKHGHNPVGIFFLCFREEPKYEIVATRAIVELTVVLTGRHLPPRCETNTRPSSVRTICQARTDEVPLNAALLCHGAVVGHFHRVLRRLGKQERWRWPAAGTAGGRAAEYRSCMRGSVLCVAFYRYSPTAGRGTSFGARAAHFAKAEEGPSLHNRGGGES